MTNPSPQTPHDATDSHTIILALSVGHGHHLFWVNGVRRLNLSRSLSQIWSPVWNRSYWNRNPSVDWIWMLNYIKLNHTSLQHASKLSLMSSYKVTHFLKTSCMWLEYLQCLKQHRYICSSSHMGQKYRFLFYAKDHVPWRYFVNVLP